MLERIYSSVCRAVDRHPKIAMSVMLAVIVSVSMYFCLTAWKFFRQLSSSLSSGSYWDVIIVSMPLWLLLGILMKPIWGHLFGSDSRSKQRRAERELVVMALENRWKNEDGSEGGCAARIKKRKRRMMLKMVLFGLKIKWMEEDVVEQKSIWMANVKECSKAIGVAESVFTQYVYPRKDA